MAHTITDSDTLLAHSSSERPRSADFTGSPVVAIATAAGIVGLLFWSSATQPLPALGWAAAFLAVAVYHDVTRLRIPNWLTLPAIVTAVAAAGITAGVQALGTSLLGALTALAILFIPFSLRWLGAGDVKAVVALGALWGATNVVGALWWMIVTGGLLAIVVITFQGGLIEMLRRWFNSACLTLRCGQIVYLRPPANSAARAGLPFAIAMGLGSVAYQIWGSPWM
jgi:prepilin peptidase CpaA